MRLSALKYMVLSWVSGLTSLILFLVPLHALLTVWIASNFGHYIAWRLWKEALLIVCIIGTIYLLLADHKIRKHTLSRRLVWLIITYALLNIIWALLAVNQHDVTSKAAGYALIINLRFLAFFLVTWAVALRMARLRVHWERLVLWPAAVVVIFGLLQIFILPHDFLRHFGYSQATIPAYETINHNQHYIRIASTLRGANPLGAYLLIPITLLCVLMIRKGRNWRQGLFLAGATAVLLFSFSRSAFVGVVMAVITVLFLSHLSRKTQKLTLGLAAILVIAGSLLTILFRHNMHYQNFIFHTQTNSSIRSTSNGGHASALKSGLNDIEHEPLGSGPGTAGPASVYNDHKVRLAENYFLQIGQETGLIGFLLFSLICGGVGALLYVRRADPLALSLFASLIGLTFINLLSHAWADDTLAYVWWGLAGVAMVPLPKDLDAPQDAKV